MTVSKFCKNSISKTKQQLENYGIKLGGKIKNL